MIKAKVQLFDDASGNDIGEQKIVSSKALNIHYFSNKDATAEVEFDFSTEYPASLFENISFDDMEWSISRTY